MNFPPKIPKKLADEFAGVGDRYLSISGSDRNPGKHPADMVDAKWSTKSETASAFFQRLSSCADTIK